MAGRIVSGFRSLLATGITVSWLAASNHCALEVEQRRPIHASETGCPFHSQGAVPEKGKQSNAQPCCKILRAILTPAAKAPSPTVIDLIGLGRLSDFELVQGPDISADWPVLDTGPPGVFSFAELVLQGSIFAHGPPFIA